MGNSNENKSNIGMTIGVTIGFLAGLLLNVMFIPMCIAIGVGYDKIKNKDTV